MGSFVIMSGPSCIGKGPLHAAIKRLRPDLAVDLQPLVLYNDRDPRPGEVDGRDYHFRSRAEILALREDENYLVMEVRGDFQAVDLAELREMLDRGDVFYEGNPFVAAELLRCPLPEDIERPSVFLSPLSQEEVESIKQAEHPVNIGDFVAEIMRRKLLRRTQRQKGPLALTDLEEIQRRCTSAYREMKMAWRFDWVIPNHDGEDSENWDAFYYPVGDARLAMLSVMDLLEGRPPRRAERWDQNLLP
ncbi:MAG: hypothetical protein GVY16_06820 [Planctomycetes bacterium]|nr:hypothetical protein [Planctomycetota bacterium]